MPASIPVTITDIDAYQALALAFSAWAREMENRLTPLSSAESSLLVAAANFFAAEADAMARRLFTQATIPPARTAPVADPTPAGPFNDY